LSAKSRVKIGNGDAESRIDYLSDRLGIKKEDVLRVINTLRGEKILADIKDLLAFIKRTGKINTSLNILYDFDKLEKEIINNFSDEED
jgi:ATP-dependent DNA helicase RecQ